MKKKLLILCAGLTLFSGVLLLSSQRGGLGYFSPYTLEYEVQSEYTIGGTGGVPLFRSFRKPIYNEFIEMLKDDGFVAPQSANHRWETVFHWNDSWRDGYSSLYYIFHRERAMTWSRNNPECATIFWHRVFQLLRSENEREILIGRALLSRYREIFLIEDAQYILDTIEKMSNEYCYDLDYVAR